MKSKKKTKRPHKKKITQHHTQPQKLPVLNGKQLKKEHDQFVNKLINYMRKHKWLIFQDEIQRENCITLNYTNEYHRQREIKTSWEYTRNLKFNWFRPLFEKGFICQNLDNRSFLIHYQIVEQQDDGETLAIQCFCPADPLLQFRDFVPFENQWCIIYEGIFKANEKEVIIISEKSLSDLMAQIEIMSSPLEQFFLQPCILGAKNQKIGTFADNKNSTLSPGHNMYRCAMSLIYYYLSQHQRSTSRQNSEEHQPTIKIDPQSKETTMKTYGPMIIKAITTMRRYAEEITYRTPSWQRRGYVRTMKNGKQVYVKPAVCHRKCMKDNTTAPAKVAITFDNKV